MNLEEKASQYGNICDPCNETLEKQADIRQGFKKGYNECISDIKDFIKANPKITADKITEYLNSL